jgi:hypothetical protein
MRFRMLKGIRMDYPGSALFVKGMDIKEVMSIPGYLDVAVNESG